MACSDNSVLGSDVTVGLNTEFELGDKRMRNLGPLTVFRPGHQEGLVTLYAAKRT
jgi:hypothetical protein